VQRSLTGTCQSVEMAPDGFSLGQAASSFARSARSNTSMNVWVALVFPVPGFSPRGVKKKKTCFSIQPALLAHLLMWRNRIFQEWRYSNAVRGNTSSSTLACLRFDIQA